MSAGVSGGRRHALAPKQGARIPISVAKPLGEDTSPWFWNPSRIGVEFAPEWFRAKVKEIDPDLDVCWSRANDRWQVWFRKPSLQTPLCQGWQLLFPVQDAQGVYVPLDERTLAKIYSISAAHWGGGKRYYDAVVREMERDRVQAEKAERADTFDHAGEYFDFTKPKVGFGRISSSKVVGQ